jgi:hypothetical protein
LGTSFTGHLAVESSDVDRTEKFGRIAAVSAEEAQCSTT